VRLAVACRDVLPVVPRALRRRLAPWQQEAWALLPEERRALPPGRAAQRVSPRGVAEQQAWPPEVAAVVLQVWPLAEVAPHGVEVAAAQRVLPEPREAWLLEVVRPASRREAARPWPAVARPSAERLGAALCPSLHLAAAAAPR